MGRCRVCGRERPTSDIKVITCKGDVCKSKDMDSVCDDCIMIYKASGHRVMKR